MNNSSIWNYFSCLVSWKILPIGSATPQELGCLTSTGINETPVLTKLS